MDKFCDCDLDFTCYKHRSEDETMRLVNPNGFYDEDELRRAYGDSYKAVHGLGFQALNV